MVAYMQRMRDENPAKYRAIKKRTRKNCAERRKADWRKWYHADPERARARVQKWREENREKRNAHASRSAAVRTARQRANGGTLTTKEWERIKKNQDGRCFDCGLVRKLTVGHKVPICKGGSSDVSNIIGQCAACNRKQGTQLHPSVKE